MADGEPNWTLGGTRATSESPNLPIPAAQSAPSQAGGSKVAAHVRAITTVALALGVFVAAANLTQAVVEGLGSDPPRQVAVGVTLLALGIALLAGRERVIVWLREARWRIIVLAALQLGLVASEGLLESPYYSSCLIPVGIVAISGRARAVWACALLIDAIVAVAVLTASSPAELARSGRLGTALGALAAPVIAAFVLDCFARLEGRVVDRMVAAAGRASAIAAAEDPERLLLGRPSSEPPWEALEVDELRVMRGLAQGGSNRAIGKEVGYSETAVKELLRSARRKTGARTREQLAALAVHPLLEVDEISEP
ncbi:MAG TPA: helix-turn-helix transcriptional regulator [Solirubrobacteraceae bacterium]|jgi:DNA-binding NarL/FixJ family response regulator|nr:helix-turn-helix transcriptional regulator [Solirubrobacteraceae bacterium]